MGFPKSQQRVSQLRRLHVVINTHIATVYGGTTPGSGNLISGNLGGGIEVGGTGTLVEGNLIGTDFTGKNPLPNGPGTGEGVVQNYSVFTAAQPGASGLISGTLNGQANTTFTVHVYASPTVGPSGLGQGLYYLGETTFTTDGSGNTRFAADFSAASLPGGVLSDGWAISATATDPNGNTAEFSKGVLASSVNALQGVLTFAGTVNIQVTTPNQAQAVLAAANSLDPSTTPTATIVLDLGGQTIHDTIAEPAVPGDARTWFTSTRMAARIVPSARAELSPLPPAFFPRTTPLTA